MTKRNEPDLPSPFPATSEPSKAPLATPAQSGSSPPPRKPRTAKAAEPPGGGQALPGEQASTAPASKPFESGDITEERPNLAVDPRIQNLVPPQTEEERRELLRDLLEVGCLEAIVACEVDGELTLLDGHHRLALCSENGIPYRVRILPPRTFPEAITWVIRHQLARRNLNPLVASYLRGRLYDETKRRQGDVEPGSGQKVQNGTTAEKLGEANNVDERTIRRDAQFACQLDTLGETCGETVKHKILSGEVVISRGDLDKLASKRPSEQKAVVTDLLAQGKFVKPKQARPKLTPAAALAKKFDEADEADQRAFLETALADPEVAAMVRELLDAA